MTNNRVVGVLGGLGPEATVDFMAKVVAATDAPTDQAHIHMLIDHNPAVPNRHDAIAGRGPDVSADLAAMAQRLESAGADFLVMVCNTAHAWAPDIRGAVSIPFVSIVDVTLQAVAERSERRVGVMAAEGCLRAGLYQDALRASGYEPVLWNADEEQHFMELVYRIKAGEQHDDIPRGLNRLAGSLVSRGAELLIAGCTEIPLHMSSDDAPVPMLASTDLLVARTIALARGASW